MPKQIRLGGQLEAQELQRSDGGTGRRRRHHITDASSASPRRVVGIDQRGTSLFSPGARTRRTPQQCRNAGRWKAASVQAVPLHRGFPKAASRRTDVQEVGRSAVLRAESASSFLPAAPQGPLSAPPLPSPSPLFEGAWTRTYRRSPRRGAASNRTRPKMLGEGGKEKKLAKKEKK